MRSKKSFYTRSYCTAGISWLISWLVEKQGLNVLRSYSAQQQLFCFSIFSGSRRLLCFRLLPGRCW